MQEELVPSGCRQILSALQYRRPAPP